MKVIQKHPLPLSGFSNLSLGYGSKFVAIGYEGEQLFAYTEGQPWGGAYSYWDVQVVREGESFNEGMQFIGMGDDRANTGMKLFVVGRING